MVTGLARQVLVLRKTGVTHTAEGGRRKSPRKEGNHKVTKTQSFFWTCLSYKQKSLPLCLRVFVVQGFLSFATPAAQVTVVVCGVGMGINASLH